MGSGIAEKSLSFYAKVAGISLLLVVIAGIFANVFVLGALLVPDDAAATADNITSSNLLFRFGILVFIFMFMLDLVIAWALYILLKQVSKTGALLTIFFRAVYAAISAAPLASLLSISYLLSDGAQLGALDPSQVDLEMLMSIESANNAWIIGTLFFSVHMLLLGYLVFKSGFIPKVFGILLLLGGLGYLVDNIVWVLTAEITDLMVIFSIIAFVLGIAAELAFAIWLLVKGNKVFERMQT